ncbi:hypothetical protein HZY83_05375 [Gemella sp. GH3]|uniref:TcpD family membrane protein n=1 Tax=unclassified Gemella TaxID=2624949 RepID=UPI0015D00A36|nr:MULTISPECIES: TcpD family membrane protein [unclassified Gemella]MBF0714102.1 hypothetical protein [Gemella sp. GH3.1]NYS51054.1 hypothetical protein [Gemella sp. GH3]
MEKLFLLNMISLKPLLDRFAIEATYATLLVAGVVIIIGLAKSSVKIIIGAILVGSLLIYFFGNPQAALTSVSEIFRLIFT